MLTPVTRNPALRFAALVLAGIVLMSTACGGASSEATATGDDRPDSLADFEWESPLGDFLGASGQFDNDDFEQQYEQEQQEIEALVAECMAAEGFEYVPDSQSQIFFSNSSDDLPYGSDEWVDKYGFGISTQRFSQEEVGPDLIGMIDDFSPTDTPEDPNETYLNSLTQPELDAWYEALYGPEESFGDPDDFESEQDFIRALEEREPVGCYGLAEVDVRGASQFGPPTDGFAFTFGDELQDLFTRIEADPKIIAFETEISSCLSEQGLTFLADQEMYEYFEEKMSGIGPNFFDGDPLVDAGLDPEEMTDRELDDFFRDLSRLDDDDRAALALVQAEEIELAVATRDCGGGPVDQALIFTEVRREYEERFLTENADRLAEFEGEGW